jgi:hypothetical protein
MVATTKVYSGALSIFDAKLNDVQVVGYHVAFGESEAAFAGFHLDAVVGRADGL